MGLCSDGATLIPSADYRQSLDTILRELRVNELRQSVPFQEGATRPMDLIWLDYPKTPKRANFPTWVTDWQALWNSESAQIYSSIPDRGMSFGYLACGRSPHEVNLSDNGLVLVARGHIFDTVREMSLQEPQLTAQLSSSFVKADTQRLVDKSPYVTLVGTYGAVWRTLMMDRGSRATSRASARFGAHFPSLFSVEAENFIAQRPRAIREALCLVRDFSIHGRRLDEWAELGPALLPAEDVDSTSGNTQQHSVDADKASLEDFIEWIELGHVYRRFMTTERGYIGLGHSQSQVGDLICLLQGCSMPTILRPFEGGYTVVGECYVHGIMDGEFWDAQDEDTMQEFHLK